MIGAVVVTGPTRLLAEQRMPCDGFRRHDSVVQLPRAQQLVQVLCTELLCISLQVVEELQRAVEQRLARHVEHAVAADVFVHQLLQPLQALQRGDEIR